MELRENSQWKRTQSGSPKTESFVTTDEMVEILSSKGEGTKLVIVNKDGKTIIDEEEPWLGDKREEDISTGFLMKHTAISVWAGDENQTDYFELYSCEPGEKPERQKLKFSNKPTVNNKGMYEGTFVYSDGVADYCIVNGESLTRYYGKEHGEYESLPVHMIADPMEVLSHDSSRWMRSLLRYDSLSDKPKYKKKKELLDRIAKRAEELLF